MGLYFLYLTLICLAIFYPVDAAIAAETIWLKVKIFFLDAVLLIQSYIIYRKLKADFERMQIPVPPFRFTSIQERH